MNEIKRAKYNDVLIRATGQDVGPPAPFLGGEVVPTFPVEQLTMDIRWLLGYKTYRARASATGAAGGVAGFRLLNPLGSGIIAVIERFSIMPTTAVQISWGMSDFQGGLSTIITAIGGLDTRVGSSASKTNPGAVKVSTETTQPVGSPPFSNPLWSLAGQANVNYEFEEELVLAPGTNFDMFTHVNASAAWFNARWRERSVDALELNA